MASVFRGTLEFFNEIGVYDVVLPFLLVFTIVFAILEKSKIFGMMEVEGTQYTRKSLNAMVAFVVAFLVIGSSQLVSIINQSLAHMVLLLVLIVSFLILAGSFNRDEEYYLQGGWNKFFMVIMFIAIVAIFLNAIGWLDYVYTYITLNWTSTTVSSIILVAIIIFFIVMISRPQAVVARKKKEEAKS